MTGPKPHDPFKAVMGTKRGSDRGPSEYEIFLEAEKKRKARVDYYNWQHAKRYSKWRIDVERLRQEKNAKQKDEWKANGVDLVSHNVTAIVPIPQWVIDNSVIDIESFVTSRLSKQMDKRLALAMAHGIDATQYTSVSGWSPIKYTPPPVMPPLVQPVTYAEMRKFLYSVPRSKR